MIQTRWYKCENSKCDWKGQNIYFEYKGLGLKGRKRVCPKCGNPVEKLYKKDEEINE
jgi:hypothetical protein